MADRLAKLLWGLVVAVGLAAVGLGLSVFVEAWQTSRAWVGAAEALHADLPAEAPIWLDQPPAVSGPSDVGVETGFGGSAGTAGPAAMDAGAMNRAPTGPASVGARFIAPATPSPTVVPVSSSPDVVSLFAPGVTPTAIAVLGEAVAAEGSDRSHPVIALVPPGAGDASQPEAEQRAVEDTPPGPPAPNEIALAEADFRFLDPPEPGAHARLAITLQSRADRPTGPLTLVMTSRWLQSFQVFGAIPAVLDDRPGGEGERQFIFGGLAPGERLTLELHVLASAEEVDAPDVRILLSDGAEIGRAHPRTVAPRPRPGPARAIAIPKLGVKAAVVPVRWEPPPFVVGQLQGTSAVSEGNTVLVGHLKGPAGDVFERLDRLRPGDEVVAMSRGLEYRFVVSEVAVRPYDDVQPTQATTTPRLTMMTCTGTWSITRQDYSHRLWVVAEPPELAQQTIQANAERATQAAREAELAAAARAIHEAEAQSAPPPGDAAVAVAATAVPPASPGRPDPASAPTGPTPHGLAVAPPASAAGATPPAPPVGAEPEPSGTGGEILTPGIGIDAPTGGATVAQRLVVRGRRTPEAPAELALWLVVRADLEGSRWYVLDRPLDVKPDGSWEAPIELGGAAGIRHEIRVGAVDAAAEAALRQHAAQRAGQPLDDLPPGFQTGARVTVERR